MMSHMKSKQLTLLCLIISGEAIFMLPFLVPRLFRPLMIETWNLSNTDIGLAFSAYGFTSMISYLLGGPFADKYSSRKLISSSLFLTAFGGIAFITFPSKTMLILIYACFGISTTFLMWGALIKTTHLFGGKNKRSFAMGLLDSGRGLCAAVVSSLLVYLITLKHFSHIKTAYWLTITFVIIAAMLSWFCIGDIEESTSQSTRDWSIKKAMIVFKDLNIWLLGLIVLSSYCGYKNIDNYSIYLVDVRGLSLERSSFMTSIIFWVRPISALLGGIITDRMFFKFRLGRVITLGLLMSFASLSQLSLVFLPDSSLTLFFSLILLSACFAYALRSIYFSLFSDLGINDSITGTAIGIVSLIGFLPDLFFGSLTGYLIDSSPGLQGYKEVFSLTAGFLGIGAVSCALIYFRLRQKSA